MKQEQYVFFAFPKRNVVSKHQIFTGKHQIFEFSFHKGDQFRQKNIPKDQEWVILLEAVCTAMLDVTVAVEALAFDQWSDSVPRPKR